jgi:outer membrane protein assembly factor BamB
VTTAHLSLFCLDARDGKVIWSRDILKEHEGRNISWQNAASPLVDGDFVFMAGGGAGQALLGIDKRTGKTVWKAQNDRMTHATPVAAVIHGVRQVIFFTQSGLVAVTPAAGAVLWRHPFKYSTSTAASPVVAGDIVFCSAGYGVGGGAARITKSGSSFKAEELWRITGNGFNHWSTPVHKDGYLYGMFGFKEYGQCPLKCVDIKTGKAVWSKEGFGPGNVILVDGNVLALGDAGQLVLVEGTAAGYNELARTEAVAGKCWSTPVMANGRAYVRSTKEAACLDLSPGIATAD